MQTKSVFKFIGLLLVFTFLFSACAKDEDEPEEETPGTVTPPPAKFAWTINGGAEVVANETFFVPAYNNIYGTKTGGKNIDILLEDLSKGTHNIAPSNGITLEYTDGGTTYSCKSGSVVITENTGLLVSGNFHSVYTSAGSSNTIIGTFSSIPKK